MSAWFLDSELSTCWDLTTVEMEQCYEVLMYIITAMHSINISMCIIIIIINTAN